MRPTILLTLVLVLAACTAQPTVPAPSLAEAPYTNLELGYSIRAPQGWVVEEGEEPGFIIFLDNRVKPTSSGLPAMPVSVTVLAGERSSLGVPAGEANSGAVFGAFARKIGVGMKIEASAPVAAKVAGKPAAKAEVGGTLNVGTELAGRVVLVDLGGRVWGAFALAPAGEWKAFEPYFEQMLGSVTFLK